MPLIIKLTRVDSLFEGGSDERTGLRDTSHSDVCSTMESINIDTVASPTRRMEAGVTTQL